MVPIPVAMAKTGTLDAYSGLVLLAVVAELIVISFVAKVAVVLIQSLLRT
jgi:hypothetical protein